MPTARQGDHANFAAEVNGVVYVIGGDASGACTSANEAYDTSSGTWSTKAPAPTPVCGSALVADNGLLYLIGGSNTPGNIQYALVQIYDPVGNAWSSGAAMPTPRSGAGAAVIGGIIYVVGGSQSSGNLTTLEAYDPLADSWVELQTMPTARGALSAGAIDGLLYVVGGDEAASPNTNVLSTNEVYDPMTNSWSSAAPAPFAVGSASGTATSNAFYVIGGYVTNSIAVNQVFTPRCSIFAFLSPVTDLVCAERKFGSER